MNKRIKVVMAAILLTTSISASVQYVSADVVDEGTSNEEVIAKDIKVYNIKAQDFYNVLSGRLTQDSNEFLNKLNSEYKLMIKDPDGNVISSLDELFFANKEGELAVKVKVVKDSGDINDEAYKKIAQPEMILNMAMGKVSNKENENYVLTLAGIDRYTTAVNIAKEAVNEGAKVDKVVLVSGDNKAMVDGLTAAPLANSLRKNSEDMVPILLTKKDEVPKSVKDFLIEKDIKNVYIIGGENGVSKKVEDEIKYNGIKTERISGDNRYQTSDLVARKIVENVGKDVDVFVVGGYSEADSLSIAGFAASKNSPIVLMPKSGLSDEVKYFIQSKTNDKTIDVIGGENSVSQQAIEMLKQSINVEVNRISGIDRQTTNAEVLKYVNSEYENEESPNIVVARGDGKSLIDALAAGPYVGFFNNSRLVLTGKNGLNEMQKNVIKSTKYAFGETIGYGVSDEDSNYIYKLLDQTSTVSQ